MCGERPTINAKEAPPRISVAGRLIRRDPAGITTLQRRYASAMGKRFLKLKGLVNEAIIKNDVLGLKESTFRTLQSPPEGAFAFMHDAAKVDAFMEWLESEIDQEIIDAPPGWSEQFISDSYRKGLRQGQASAVAAGVVTNPEFNPFFSISNRMGNVPHLQRVQLLYTRNYNALRGVTQEMSTQIARELADGVGQGMGVAQIARNINDRIDKIGLVRAKTIARTETMRAHHIANITELEALGVMNIQVKAEWKTAGYNVCPDCAWMNGRVFTLKEIEPLIPLHPNCRCVAIPIQPGEKGAKYDPESIDEQYIKKDGSQSFEGLYEKQTGKPLSTLPGKEF